jgi:hypothetical protein
LGDRISVLSIQSVAAAHNGEYTCTAENPAGIANYTAELTVNGTIALHTVATLVSWKKSFTTFILPFQNVPQRWIRIA